MPERPPGQGAALASSGTPSPTVSRRSGVVASAVLCQGVDGANQPIKPGNAFRPETPLIALVVSHQLPAHAQAEIGVTLLRDGHVKSRHQADVSGAGKFVVEYRPGEGGRFLPGQWSVRIEVGRRSG